MIISVICSLRAYSLQLVLEENHRTKVIENLYLNKVVEIFGCVCQYAFAYV